MTPEPSAVDEQTAEHPVVDEPTGEWPAPSRDADPANDDTDPFGFAPISPSPTYPPPGDPFDDEPFYDEPLYDEPFYDEPFHDEPFHGEPLYNETAEPFGDVAAEDDPHSSSAVASRWARRTGWTPGSRKTVPLPGWNAPPEPEPVRSRLRRARKPLLIGAAAVVLAGLVTAIVLAPKLVGGPGRTETAALPGGGGGGGSVTGPVDGLAAATFALVDGAGQVRLTAADLGGDLYRITTPAAGGVRPTVDRDGAEIRLHLASAGRAGAASVDIVLNAAVRWTLHLNGGSDHTRADLSGAQVDAVDLTGGARQIDLTLPAPRGLVTVRMTGGVDQFQVRLPGATPVRVRVQAGAGQVTLAGATHRGIAAGQSFTANGWGTGGAGIDLLAVAGLSALTVTGS